MPKPPLPPSVRQLWDGKGSAPVDVLDPDALGRYGELCGWALARAHARSGDAVAIGSYLGAGNTFDRAMCAFADGYADQNQRDRDSQACRRRRPDRFGLGCDKRAGRGRRRAPRCSLALLLVFLSGWPSPSEVTAVTPGSIRMIDG